MRKEIIFAIIAGIVFGLIVALGIWRANSALEKKPAITESKTTEEKPQKASQRGLTLLHPDQNDVFTTSPITVNGITSPNTWVALSAERTQYTVLSNNVGEFEAEVELEAGLNRILVTSFIEDQKPQELTVQVVYSTEFGSSNKEGQDEE